MADPAVRHEQLAPSSRIDQQDARLMEVVNTSRTMAEAAARLGVTRVG